MNKSTINHEQLNVLSLCQGHIISQLMIIAYNLNIHNHLKNDPVSIDDLANITKTNIHALKRFMKTLCTFDIVCETSPNNYTASHLTDQLNLISPIFNGDLAYQAWQEALHTIKTGEPAWNKIHNQSVYNTLNKNEQLSKSWDEWNSRSVKLWLEPLILDYDFKPFQSVVDIGGGDGKFLSIILKNNPHIKGILFDRECTIKNSINHFESDDIRERFSTFSGSFFDLIPMGQDLYCCSRVLINWSDSEVINILKNIRNSMNKHSKLLIIDMFLPQPEDPLFRDALLHDLNMFVIFGGRFRSIEEMHSLIDAASMNISKIIPPLSSYGLTMIEVTNK